MNEGVICVDCEKELPYEPPEISVTELAHPRLAGEEPETFICEDCRIERRRKHEEAKQKAINKVKDIVYAPKSVSNHYGQPFVCNVEGKLVMGLHSFNELDKFSFAEISQEFYDAFVKEFADRQDNDVYRKYVDGRLL